MDTARTLEEKRERVLEQMRAIRSMRPGSVTEQYLKVTHKGKRKPVMRGPYWVYTRKEAGKTVGQRLSRGRRGASQKGHRGPQEVWLHSVRSSRLSPCVWATSK